MVPLRIVWNWWARAIASGLAVVSAAIVRWAALDPQSSVWEVLGSGLLAAATAFMALETYVYRVEGDAAGLRRRSLRGTDALGWGEVHGVRLVATRHTGLAIVHTRTRCLDEAFHLRLIAKPQPRRPWDFNVWMAGFDGLRALAVARRWPLADDPEAAVDAWVAKTEMVLHGANEIVTQLVFGFALVVGLFIASLAIVAGAEVEVTGNLFLDLVLVAGALLGCAGLVDALVKCYGARRMVQEGASGRERRTLWIVHAASLIGGVLLLVAFVPRALAGGPDTWVSWVMVGLGGCALLGALKA